jgi:hypothetical protein
MCPEGPFVEGHHQPEVIATVELRHQLVAIDRLHIT